MKVKLPLLILTFLISLLVLSLQKISSQKANFNEKEEIFKTIRLGNMEFIVEVADNEAERARGLSNRTFLPQGRGRLFIFPKRDRYSFWMKEMKFALDFIWIDGQTVVEIAEAVPYPKENEPSITIRPTLPVDKVLEINAGVASRSGVKVGDKISGL